MRVACAAALSLMLAGCVPTMKLAEGEERDRVLALVRQFCSAELSADPGDTAPLLARSIVGTLDQLPAQDVAGERRYLTSVSPSGGCEPGRVWYRGGSRVLAEVRLGGRSDRLDFWRGDRDRIHNILYGTKRPVAGGRASNLREALWLEAAATGVSPVPPSPPAVPDPACYPGTYRFAFLATDTQVYRQGATVKIAPTLDVAPAGTREVPLKCVSGWTVSGPATLSPDRTSLTIAADAAPGSVVRIAFSHAGKPVATELRVVARDEVVLTGRYSQKSVTGCLVTEPVGELEFSPGNRFAVTFRPFETYRDYWGRYEFDPATGKLKLTVEGGNFVPDVLDLEGEADVSAGALVLRHVYLGSRSPTPWSGCTYSF